MIRKLGSDLKSFKTLTFGPGLNVILAEKSPGASDLQSRNSVGKTSFVELVHFLFGADARPKSIFRSEALRNSTFNASVEIGGEIFSISRSGKRPSHVHIDGDMEDWPIDSHPGFFRVQRRLTNTQWKNVLGALWFGLSSDGDNADKFTPSFPIALLIRGAPTGEWGVPRPDAALDDAAALESTGNSLLLGWP